MNIIVYNISMLSGVVLTSVGVGLIHVPSGLIVAGILVLAATVFNAVSFR